MSSSAVVLCGHEAAEVPILKDYILWKGSIIAVDYDKSDSVKKGLALAASYGAITYNKPIDEVISGLDNIGFIHLDWTGTIKDYELRVMKQAARRLKIGGVVACTFLAARDKGNEILEYAKHVSKRTNKIIPSREAKDVRRTMASLLQVEMQLTRPGNWKTLFVERYNSGKSPMMTAAFAYTPSHTIRLPKHKYDAAAGNFIRVNDEDLLRYRPDQHYSLLREKILRLIGKGADSKILCSLYNIKATTLAAWKAHQTMGSYRK